MQPVFAAFGAKILVASDPIANNAISQEEKSNVSRFCVFKILSEKVISVPMDFLEARTAILSTGNSRSERILSISLPTFPVAPTITIL